jgi:hypothetical protein
MLLLLLLLLLGLSVLLTEGWEHMWASRPMLLLLLWRVVGRHARGEVLLLLLLGVVFL